jgi:cyclophilin family peptidyl-prolyl cis-trans isomerase
VAAGLIQNPELNFKTEYPDAGFLKTALDKLKLPQDVETYQELQKAIAYLEGKNIPPNPQNPFSHPIDWQFVQNIPVRQLAEIQTNKGEITLELFVEDAPGTVANFVQLAQSNFFDGKNFHRVVPNFVVQGGDPRGDGWGGTDYALRSEFANLRYREGYVGMASAGKDTESCQWFITHSPTPHLDGRYTIFARVTKGLDVLHLLEVGDKIEQVKIR